MIVICSYFFKIVINELFNCLGERPPLPDNLRNDPKYKQIIELFDMCTIQDYHKRPSAKQILHLMGIN